MKSWIRNATELAHTLWRLRHHLRGGRYLVAFVLASSLLAAAFEGFGVTLLIPLLSLLLGGEAETPIRPVQWLQNWFPGHGREFYIMFFCGLVLGAISFKNALFYCSQVLAAKLKRRVAIHLRDDLFERLLRAEIRVFEEQKAGEVANLFLTETERTIRTVDYLILFCQRCSMAIFYFAALLIVAWSLTLMTVGLALLIGSIIGILYRRLIRSGRELTVANDRLGAWLLEAFSGARLIRTTNTQEQQLGRFKELNQTQALVEEESARTNALLVPLVETAAVAGALILIGTAYLFFVQPGLMLSSQLLGFSFILLRVLPLMNQVYSLQGHLFYLAGGLQTVESWLALPPYPDRPFGNRTFASVKSSIRFECVSFQYPRGSQALENVSFELPAGKMVAVAGESGSGKSTLATLLLRLRRPARGRITVDGIDHWEFTPESWHRGVAAVEQEAFLFHDTMACNIALGWTEAPREAIEKAVRLAQLEDVIEHLPQGLDTMVGERGTMLSGGQRQRLAIARALVRDPHVLILDEATSALDSISEKQVQAALKEAMKGRAVLVIAHRLATIRHADKIIVLSQGKLVEEGTWEELSRQGGIFSTLLDSSPIEFSRDSRGLVSLEKETFQP